MIDPNILIITLALPVIAIGCVCWLLVSRVAKLEARVSRIEADPIPNRWVQAMSHPSDMKFEGCTFRNADESLRPRKEDGLGAPENPAV